jgi:hypothetical protein
LYEKFGKLFCVLTTPEEQKKHMAIMEKDHLPLLVTGIIRTDSRDLGGSKRTWKDQKYQDQEEQALMYPDFNGLL